jgi:hypothetical protein
MLDELVAPDAMVRVIDAWGGILAPAKTPRALGADPNPSTPAEMDAFVVRQLTVVTQIAKKAGIEPQ